MPTLSFVVAVAENGVMGRDGQLPFRLKSDLKHFKAETLGKPVVMGRKTYESIGRPLPGRTNIVVTRDAAFGAPGIVVATSLAAALDTARGDAFRRGVADIAIIGGAEIYRQLLPVADRLVVTHVALETTGETIFPPIDPAVWKAAERREHTAGAEDDADFAIVTYLRRDRSVLETDGN